jgi:adenylate cyclase
MSASALGPNDETSEFSEEFLSGIGRKLTVLTADFVAYSEMMHRDLSSGIAVLRKTRSILTNCIRQLNGKVLQTPGDFILATFDVFEDSLRAASAAQDKLLRHHQMSSHSQAGHWKIGIAYGEVYAIDDDYFGNAINVAARLQAMAAPGEIYFADGFKDLVTPENLIIEDLGFKKLKNIDQPVPVHRGVLTAYDDYVRASKSKFVTPPTLLKRLSKPVLRLEPFRNINETGKGELIGDALVEEIHLILSRLSNTIAVTDPNGSIPIHHDYVLSGAIQSRGPYLRIIARLASTIDGQTIWTDRFDCDLNQSFDVQDQISQEIVSALQLHLTDGEHVQLWRRGTRSGKAWELFQRAHDIERKFTKQGHEKAKALYQDALGLDQNYLSASVALAFCHLDEVRLGWSRNVDASVAEADRLCILARQNTADHPDVFALQAFLNFFQNRWTQAAAEMQKAVELAPHSPEIKGYEGALNDLMGNYDRAILAYTHALSLSAHTPAWIPSNLGLSYLAVGNIEESERIYREVLNHHPNYVRAWIGLAVTLNRQGKSSEGQSAAKTVIALDPTFSSSEWAKSRPFQDDVLIQQFVSDLNAVGIPD